MVNGRNTRLSFVDDRLELTFNAGSKISISFKHFKAVAVSNNKVGVHLSKSQVVLPRTVKPVCSVVFTAARGRPDDEWHDTQKLLAGCSGTDMLDCSAAEATIVTACERCTLHLLSDKCGNRVVVWRGNECHVVNDLKAAILQRTSGGMSTYDVHVLPCKGPIVTVDMLPHSTMQHWNEIFGDLLTVNAGADPVNAKIVQDAQKSPSVHDFIKENAVSDVPASSDDGSSWDSDSDEVLASTDSSNDDYSAEDSVSESESACSSGCSTSSSSSSVSESESESESEMSCDSDSSDG